MKKYKLAILVSHPIQYQVPFYRKLAQNPAFEIMVYYCWDFGVKETYDPGFGRMVQWDTPLLTGYPHMFLRNISPRPTSVKPWGEINPGIVSELLSYHYDAILIHGYTFISDWLAFFAAWVTRTPIFLRGESHLLERRSPGKAALKRFILVNLFRGISRFLAIGTLNREYYMHYEVPEKKIFSAPYIANEDLMWTESFKRAEYRSALRKELEMRDDTAIILYVGKIFGGKGPGAFDLLKAFELIHSGSDAVLIFVGDGRERKMLEAYTTEHKIPRVIFAGFQNQKDLPKYYSAADIFVLPSHMEQWGVVINEAMYFNNAIIASDHVGGAYDLVRSGKNGFMFPVGDVKALAEKLRRLIENKHLLRNMQNESRKIINAWGADQCVSGVLAALESLGT